MSVFSTRRVFSIKNTIDPCLMVSVLKITFDQRLWSLESTFTKFFVDRHLTQIKLKSLSQVRICHAAHILMRNLHSMQTSCKKKKVHFDSDGKSGNSIHTGRECI